MAVLKCFCDKQISTLGGLPIWKDTGGKIEEHHNSKRNLIDILGLNDQAWKFRLWKFGGFTTLLKLAAPDSISA